MRHWHWLATVVAGVAFAAAMAQGPAGPGGEPASKPASAPAATQPEKPFHDMKLDLKNRTVTIQATVCLTEGPLELLLCKAQSKEHESILSTRARPSDLHAALLAMGLAPGLPARGVMTPDRSAMVFLPPQGAQLGIRLKWKEKGAAKEAAASDWIEIANAKKDVKLPEKWIFVGSDITGTGTYWADGDGDIISVANFGASVIDVPFESSNKNNVGLVYRAKKSAIPAAGTEVEVVIQVSDKPEEAQKAPHARVTIEVDRFGRCGLNGREIPHDQLMEWAGKYIEDHAKGTVTLRVDGRAQAFDIRRVQDELRLGGVYESNPYILQPPVATLPRTSGQAQEALKEWEKKFANPRDYIGEPGEDAAELLKQIAVQQQELKELQALHAEFSQRLTEMHKKYQATSKPAQELE